MAMKDETVELPPDAQRFRLQLEIDAARERLLLWRSLIAVELIGAFLLFREIVLWSMGYA